MSAPSPPRGPLDPASPSGLAEHYFRHEYGRLVAVLVRRVGLRHLETVEDGVQPALRAALTAWIASGIPDNPGAWLHRVAHNHLLGVLRKDHGHQSILDAAADEDGDNDEHPHFASVRRRSAGRLLRMLFVCCGETIPQDSRLVLALKTLCGFSTGEIAFRLFTIYLLFKEGYLSTNAEHAIRAELCDEAIRLGTLLANHPVGGATDLCLARADAPPRRAPGVAPRRHRWLAVVGRTGPQPLGRGALAARGHMA